MKLTKEDILKLKQIEKPFGLLDKETQEQLKALKNDLEIYCATKEWNLTSTCHFFAEFSIRLRQDYELPPEEEDKVYQWVVMHATTDSGLLQFNFTEKKMLQTCRDCKFTKYAKLKDIEQPDGSLAIDKMKSVK